jgi:hypothetical protein
MEEREEETRNGSREVGSGGKYSRTSGPTGGARMSG